MTEPEPKQLSRRMEHDLRMAVRGMPHVGHAVVRDRFAELCGVVRQVPGNAYCLTCHEPIPYTM